MVEDVHQLFNAQEDRMVDFSYLQAKMQNVHVSDLVVSDMKTEMGKKDAEIFKLQEKYKVLMNLTESQGTCIRNLKFNHLKEKEVLSTSTKNLQFQVDELKNLRKSSPRRTPGCSFTSVISRRGMTSSQRGIC